MRKFLLALALLAPIGCQGCVTAGVAVATEKNASTRAMSTLMLPITLPIDAALAPIELPVIYLWLVYGNFSLMGH